MRQPTLFLFLTAAAAGTLGIAAQPVAAQVQDRVLIIYGNDKCPANNGQEIVVCKHAPESERYRIPKDLRDSEAAPQAMGGNAMSAMATTGGTGVQVQSCNAIGAGVAAGCLTKEAAAWKAQQKADKDAAAGIP